MFNRKDKSIGFKTLPKVVFINKNRYKKEILRKKKSLEIENIGEYIEGEGVYIGIYEPKDRDGISLGLVFNLFVAKKDLDGVASYKDTIKKIKSIKDLDGHAGADFENESDLYKAFQNNSYKGEWFIPSKNIFIDVNLLKGEYLAMPQGTLYDHKDKGCLKKSFNSEYNGNDFSHWYWSSTESFNDSSNAYNINLENGVLLKLNKSSFELSTRVIRATPRI